MFALLMLFLRVILHTMSSGKSLKLLCIFPFGMLCLSAISMMFVKILMWWKNWLINRLGSYSYRSRNAIRRIRIRMILFRKYKCKWCNKNELKYIM